MRQQGQGVLQLQLQPQLGVQGEVVLPTSTASCTLLSLVNTAVPVELLSEAPNPCF